MITSLPTNPGGSLAESPLVLQMGDWMDAEEFLRRFDNMPDVKKAELLDNVVYMSSPVSNEYHSEPHTFIAYLLTHYRRFHGDCKATTDGTWVINEDCVVQPDCTLRYSVGNCWQDQRKNLRGAPELVIEISASTVSLDSHQKKAIYERAGVQEYIIWRVMDNALDFWRYDNELKLFYAAPPDARGIWSSKVFPGFNLDVAAVIRLDPEGGVAHIC